MKLCLLLLLTLLISLLLPEVESAGLRKRGRAALASRRAHPRTRAVRAKINKGSRRRSGGGRRARRVKRRRGRWEEGDPPMDTGRSGDLVSAASADPAVEAAGAAAELAGVCEAIMFERGDGTFSLKFVQNKC